jgi:hypothetical protein
MRLPLEASGHSMNPSCSTRAPQLQQRQALTMYLASTAATCASAKPLCLPKAKAAWPSSHWIRRSGSRYLT